jgi:hypothetical protein
VRGLHRGPLDRRGRLFPAPRGPMGMTAAEASDAAAQLSLDAFKQTAEWVADVFGEAAANTLFTVDGGAAFVGGSLQSDTIQLGGLIGTALSWVRIAYMIYTVAADRGQGRRTWPARSSATLSPDSSSTLYV